jgi:hypothetical protein
MLLGATVLCSLAGLLAVFRPCFTGSAPCGAHASTTS